MSRHTHLFGSSHLLISASLQLVFAYNILVPSTRDFARMASSAHPLVCHASIVGATVAVLALVVGPWLVAAPFVPIADEAASVDGVSGLFDAAIAYVHFDSIWPYDHAVAASASAAVCTATAQQVLDCKRSAARRPHSASK